MKRSSTIAAILAAVSTVFAGTTHAKSPIGERMLGSYVGFSPIAASNGALFEENHFGVTFDTQGVLLSYRIGGRPFQIRYGNEWLFDIRGGGVEPCLALRQHQSSTLARYIFCQTAEVPAVEMDIVMFLGEGMPAILGVFYKQDRGIDLVRQAYDSAYSPARPNTNTVSIFLRPFDEQRSRDTMRSGTADAKVALVEAVAQNLWVAPEDEIAQRIELIKQAVADKNPQVQRTALNTFVLGGRVVHGVDIVSRAIHKQDIDSVVLKEAVYAATCLMFEAYQRVQKANRVEKEFGTTDIDLIHQRTGGVLNAFAITDLEDVTRSVPPSRRWTRDHLATLRAALKQAIVSPLLSRESRQDAEQALVQYQIP